MWLSRGGDKRYLHVGGRKQCIKVREQLGGRKVGVDVVHNFYAYKCCLFVGG